MVNSRRLPCIKDVLQKHKKQIADLLITVGLNLFKNALNQVFI